MLIGDGEESMKKFSKLEKSIMKYFKNQSGFECLYMDDVVTGKDFLEAMDLNFRWLEDHINDVQRGCEDLMKQHPNLYD